MKLRSKVTVTQNFKCFILNKMALKAQFYDKVYSQIPEKKLAEKRR